MSVDIQASQDVTQQSGDSSEEVPLKERVDTAVAIAYGTHGYVTDDGEKNPKAVVDRVYDLVSPAVVEKRGDRGKVAITRHRLMSVVWSEVVGPADWAEQDDPEVAEGVYNRFDSQVWRMVTADSTGEIQKRLNEVNGSAANILCRTTATSDGQWAVYVTRDLSCLLADYTLPQREAIKKVADRLAMNLAMAIDRVPQHALRLHKELTGGLKTALDSGVAITAPALEAAEQLTLDEPDGGRAEADE